MSASPADDGNDLIERLETKQDEHLISPEFELADYYDYLVRANNTLVMQWETLQRLAFPLSILKRFTGLIHQIIVKINDLGFSDSDYSDYRDMGDLAKDIEFDLITLIRHEVLSDPEMEEAIGVKVRTLDDMFKNVACRAELHTKKGSVDLSKGDSLPSNSPWVIIYDMDYSASCKLAKRLMMVGYDVDTFQYLDDMEESVCRRLPHAIVADIVFQCEPNKGFERLQKIRQYGASTVPIFFTAKNDNLRARAAAVKMGADGFMLKPVSMLVLAKKIIESVGGEGLMKGIRMNRVLLLDQNPQSSEAYKLSLLSAGFEVQLLTDHNKVIFSARDYLPDLIILNIAKLNINPVFLLRLLKHDALATPCEIIVLAAEKQQKFYVELAKEGVSDFISRPLSVNDLTGLVEARFHSHNGDFARRILEDRFDYGTQLHNLPYFEERLNQKLSVADEQAYYALLHIEIDQTRRIVERYGATRLKVLRFQIAQLIVDHMGPDDLGATSSSGGFCVLYRPQRLRELDLYCQALCSKIADFSLDSMDSTCHISVSIGVCQVQICTALNVGSEFEPGHSQRESNTDAMAMAVAASTLAQQLGGNRVEWNTELKQKNERQLATQKDLVQLQEAIDEQRLRLLFQPVASLAAEELERYDVLLRFLNKDGNELESAEMLCAAKEHDRSRYIDRWVVHAAIRELSVYTKRGAYPRLFLKVSIETAIDAKFIAWLEQLLSKYDVRPEQCIFMLEELDVSSHVQAVKPFFSKLHILGCRVGVSSFGELSNEPDLLKSFKLDYMKLAPAIFDGIDNDPDMQVRLRQLCGAARKQQINVLASSIEDPHLLVSLCRYGVDLFQGYMLQKPSKEMDYDFSIEM